MKRRFLSILLVTFVAPQVCSQTEEIPRLELTEAFPAQGKFKLPLRVGHHSTDPDVYYVVEQDGVISRIPRDGGVKGREIFLDWRKRCLRKNWEEGLLGLAFDPDYADNEFIYIYYSEKVVAEKGAGAIRRRSVIARLKKIDGFAGPTVGIESELVILTVPQPFGNHNGGAILFGPDGMLYIALGDGGKANDPHGNGQNRETLLGSILRIDVRGASVARPYRIPPDNPFVGEEGGVRHEIWAWGLRNPWGISFDRETGDLWCGDVGQVLLEEVDRIVKGGNYGWNFREGTQSFELGHRWPQEPEGMIEPVVVYPREKGISITGGHVYRGSRIPELQGRYIYSDFGSGRIWAVKEDRKGGAAEVWELAHTGKQITNFAELPDGELLVLCYDGMIYSLREVKVR